MGTIVDHDPFAGKVVSHDPFENETPDEKPFDWLGALRKTLQGITIGGADEAGAGFVAAVKNRHIPTPATAITTAIQMMNDPNVKKDYDDIHGTLEYQSDTFSKDNPVLAPALEVGGALTTGILAAPKIAAVKGIAALPKYRQAASIAGIEGGTYGTLAADQGERMQGGATGAIAGGVLAPSLMAGGNLASNLARPVSKRVADALTGTPRRDAARQLATSLDREGIHSLDKVRRFDSGLETTLADTTKGGRNLASGLVTTGDEYAADKAVQYLARNKTQFHRVAGSLDEGLDIPTTANWYDVGNALRERQGKVGKELYDKAANVPLRLSKWTRGILEGNQKGHADVRKAWKTAQSKVAADRDMGDEVNNFAVINQWKKDLGDTIERHIRTGNKNEVRRLTRIKNRVIDEVDQQNPAYKTARNAWADDASILDAGEFGKKIFQADLDALPSMIARLSEPEKVAYRLGVKKAVRDKLMAAREGTNTINRISSMLNLEKMRKAFPDDAAFNKFKRGLDAEREAFETYRVLNENSRTAFRLKDVERIEGATAGTDSDLPLSKTGIVVSTLRRLFRSGLSLEARKELADMVMTPIKDIPEETLQMIQREVLKNAKRKTRQEVTELFTTYLQRPTAVASGVVPPAVREN